MTAPALSLPSMFAQLSGGVSVVRAVAEHPAPEAWADWLGGLFPSAVTAPMAPHHSEAWDRAWAVDIDSSPAPWIGVWPREGGKSTSIELIVTALGCRGARRYPLYVRKTQEAADGSVTNIAEKLESDGIEIHYPQHARPLLSKFGASRGWRRNRLRTAGGFTVDAIGLDVRSIRGLKVGDQRPDLIVLDDIDDEDDTPATIAKKIRRITTAILPAGSRNCWIIGIQNLVLQDGIFTQLVDGRAAFLSNRVVSGPHKAVRGLKWKYVDDPETGTKQAVITAGKPTWAGQDLAVCQRNMRLWSPAVFLREAQHEVATRAEGLVLRIDDAEHLVTSTLEQRQQWVADGNVFGGIDFQAWRFAWVAFAADRHGVCRRVEEIFSQREELSVRAFRIHYAAERLGIIKHGRLVKRFPMWGDSANPQDILELNAAWKRGWRDPDTGRWVKSPLRVTGVGRDAKLRRAAVMKIEDALARNALLFCRDVGADHEWLLGYTTTSTGIEMKESRLLWEIRHWSYPVLAEGKVDTKGDPDDQSADGADMMAASRYALVSYWRKAPFDETNDVEFDAWASDVLQSEADRTRRFKRVKTRSRSIPPDAIDDA